MRGVLDWSSVDMTPLVGSMPLARRKLEFRGWVNLEATVKRGVP